MRNPFRKKKQERAEIRDQIYLSDSLLEALLRPDNMTIEKAMSIPAFAGCVNLICGTAQLIPVRLYRHAGDRVEPVEKDPRIELLNDDTGDTLSGADFKSAMFYDYLTNKGAYAYINKWGNKWYSVHYVEPQYISFMENTDHIFKDFKIQCDGKTYEPYQWIRFIRRTKDGYRGKSMIEENKTLLNAVYNALILENALVKKGGNKKGFLQSQHKLSQDSVNALKEAFQKLYSTDSDAIPVLNDGVTFQEASETSVELQMNENKKQNGTEICKIFNVPPQILAGSATEKDWNQFIQYCMVPKFENFVSSLNRDFLLEKEKGTYFWDADFSELTKGDIKQRYDAYKTAVAAGFLQIDEVRKRENMPALGLPFVKLGLQDVLLNPETGDVYTPNTGIMGSIKDRPEPEGNGKEKEPEGQKGEKNGENTDPVGQGKD